MSLWSAFAGWLIGSLILLLLFAKVIASDGMSNLSDRDLKALHEAEVLAVTFNGHTTIYDGTKHGNLSPPYEIQSMPLKEFFQKIESERT